MMFQNSHVRFYVSLIVSGEVKHRIYFLKYVRLLSISQTNWRQSSSISFDILSDISFDIIFDILSDISPDILPGILSGISFNILFNILSNIFCKILSKISFDFF